MDSNPVIDVLMRRASIRRFEDRAVPEDILEKVLLAGRQAPFAGQMYSAVVVTDKERLKTIDEDAPVFILVCLDVRKLDKFVKAKGRRNAAGDLGLVWLGLQDASYFAENVVIAAEALGLGSLYLGAAPWMSDLYDEVCELPERVFPMVGLLLGYPAEHPPARPRIPSKFVWFRERYQDLTEADVEEALSVMDAGLLREGYYARLNARIRVEGIPEDHDMGYDKYGWGEHVSRKYGASQWTRESFMEALQKKGFHLE